MLRRILKWIGIVLGVLVILLAALYAFIYIRSEAIMNQTYTVPPIAITVPADAVTVQRGFHLMTAVADCKSCHGDNLAGTIIFDDSMLGRIVAPNLTTGKNGLGGQLTDEDIAHVLHCGVLPNRRSLRVMPADEFTHLTDADMAAMIAYIRSVPPVDSNLPATQILPFGRALMVAGVLDIMIAPRIDFSHVGSDPVPEAVTPEYGHYLVNIAGCLVCHGPGLSGGVIPGSPPGFPHSANLTSSGEVGTWTEAQFVQTLRTGVNPAGHMLVDPMPWQVFKNMTDDELGAVWAYIKTMPARPAGTR